jgi:hypothetical protein
LKSLTISPYLFPDQLKIDGHDDDYLRKATLSGNPCQYWLSGRLSTDYKHRDVNSPATEAVRSFMKDRGINTKHEAGALIVTAQIARQILVIRGQKVMLDADLAALYGVQTRRLNEQVRRNAERFPEDFVFQTSPAEFASLKSQFATSSWGGTRKLPLAFTEHGAIMAAMVLNSPPTKNIPPATRLLRER